MTTNLATSNAANLPNAASYRRALPWWVQISVLIVVFAAGGATGAMVMTHTIYSRMEQYRQQDSIFSKDIVARLQIRLGLNDSQAKDVLAIVEKRHSKMIQHRTENSRKMHAEFDVMVSEVTAVLDESQQERWRSISDYVRRTYLPRAVAAD